MQPNLDAHSKLSEAEQEELSLKGSLRSEIEYIEVLTLEKLHVAVEAEVNLLREVLGGLAALEEAVRLERSSDALGLCEALSNKLIAHLHSG